MNLRCSTWGPILGALVAASAVRAAAEPSSWGAGRVEAPAVHQSGFRGEGVKVAVVDTGIDFGHPDLAPSRGGDGTDLVGGMGDVGDASENSHGTHVAGIIAARDDGAGVTGVAPQASLYAVKVARSSALIDAALLARGIDWAVSNGMDVVNVSLGTSLDDPGLRQACERARAAGVLVVAAAGARSPLDVISFPAAFAPSVLAVGATTQQDAVAPFSPTNAASASGAAINLVAPGEEILSTVRGGAYDGRSGTSMAAPHVAGVAALLLSSRSPEDRRAERCAAAVDELVLALEESALDLAPAGRDRAAGAGLVQAEAALTRYRELVDARGGAPVCGKQDGGGGCSSGGASGAAGALGLLAAAALGRAGAQRSGRGTNRRRCQAVPSAQGE